MVTRSGTRDLHGALYEYLPNDKLDANDSFADRENRGKAPFRQNQYGYSPADRCRCASVLQPDELGEHGGSHRVAHIGGFWAGSAGPQRRGRSSWRRDMPFGRTPFMRIRHLSYTGLDYSAADQAVAEAAVKTVDIALEGSASG